MWKETVTNLVIGFTSNWWWWRRRRHQQQQQQQRQLTWRYAAPLADVSVPFFWLQTFLTFWHKQVFAISLFICFSFEQSNHFCGLLREPLNDYNFKFVQKNPFILFLCLSFGSLVSLWNQREKKQREKIRNPIVFFLHLGVCSSIWFATA